MLKFKYLTENFQLARQALSLWKHDEENLDKQLSFFRISSNAVYPFGFEGKLFFLRLSPVAEKDENNILCELEFLQFLSSKGLNVNLPVSSEKGKLLEKITFENEDWYACVLEGVLGKRTDDIRLGEQQLFLFGKTLGLLHSYSSQFKPEKPCKSAEDMLTEIEEEIADEEKDILEAFAKLKAEIAALPKTSQTFGVIHGDFQTDNLFYDKKTDKLSIIDFEDLHTNFFAYDVAVSLFELISESKTFLSAKKIQKAFLRGYSESCEVPSPEQLSLLYRFSLFYKYATLEKVLYENSPKPIIQEPTEDFDDYEEEYDDGYEPFEEPQEDFGDYSEDDESADEQRENAERPLWQKLLRRKLANECYMLKAQILSLDED